MTGEGKLTFAGFNLTLEPFYAHMTPETKYPFMGAWKAEQVSVGDEVINTEGVMESFEFPVQLRIQPPDMRRDTMLYAQSMLTELLDPEKKEQWLVLDEFPASYYLAKVLSAEVSKEANYLSWIDVIFGCKGPAYAMNENIMKLTELGEWSFIAYTQKKSNPRFRLTSTGTFNGTLDLYNSQHNEKISWTGSLANGDVLDFIIDEEYGTPYTVLKNGQNALASVVGPAWPHIYPGANTIRIAGPVSGQFEIRWRDRYNIGLQSATALPTPIVRRVTYNQASPSWTTGAAWTQAWTLTGNIKNANNQDIIGAKVYLHRSTDQNAWSMTPDFGANPATVAANGTYSFQGMVNGAGVYYFRTYYDGSSEYLDSFSPVIKVTAEDRRTVTYITINTMNPNTTNNSTGSLQFIGRLIYLDASETHIPIPNKPLHVYQATYPNYDNWTWIYSVNTDSSGTYNITFPVGHGGAAKYYMEFSGDVNWKPSISPSTEIIYFS